MHEEKTRKVEDCNENSSLESPNVLKDLYNIHISNNIWNTNEQPEDFHEFKMKYEQLKNKSYWNCSSRFSKNFAVDGYNNNYNPFFNQNMFNPNSMPMQMYEQQFNSNNHNSSSELPFQNKYVNDKKTDFIFKRKNKFNNGKYNNNNPLGILRSIDKRNKFKSNQLDDEHNKILLENVIKFNKFYFLIFNF